MGFLPVDVAGCRHSHILILLGAYMKSEQHCCCPGGGDFFMASKYGAYVHGVDLSVNMVTTALERAFAAKDGHKVRLFSLRLQWLKCPKAFIPSQRTSDVRMGWLHDPACMLAL